MKLSPLNPFSWKFIILCCFHCIIFFNFIKADSEVATIAGPMNYYANGVGSNALFYRPYGVSTAPDGILTLISDTFNHVIRAIDLSTGTVTLFAGGLTPGSANGIGTDAEFNFPSFIDISQDGTVAIVADRLNHMIRLITLSTAEVTLLLGTGISGSNDGNTTHAQLNIPFSAVFSPDQSFILIMDYGNHAIRIFNYGDWWQTPLVSTLAGLAGVAGNTNGIGSNALFYYPFSAAISPNNLDAYIVDQNNHMIRKVSIATGEVITLTGNGGSGNTNGIGTNANFFYPTGISISPSGRLLIVTDTSNQVLRSIDITTESVDLYAGAYQSGSSNGIGTNAAFFVPYQISFSRNGGYVLIADALNNQIRKIDIGTSTVTALAGVVNSGSANGIGSNALFYFPQDVSIFPDGTFALIADRNNNLIRKMEISTMMISTFVGSGISGYSDGLGTNALFSSPSSLDISVQGIYAVVAESSNNIIRRIQISTLTVTTLAGSLTAGAADGIGSNALFNFPLGIALSPNDQFALVVDVYNHAIRTVTTSNVITLAGNLTVAGFTNGIGSNALFRYPSDVSISPLGNYALVCDRGNHVIRKIIISTAEVSVLAGIGSPGYADGIGTNSLFRNPNGIAISADESYALIGDTANQRIRKLEISTAAVSSLAGNGIVGFVNGIGTNCKFFSRYQAF